MSEQGGIQQGVDQNAIAQQQANTGASDDYFLPALIAGMNLSKTGLSAVALTAFLEQFGTPDAPSPLKDLSCAASANPIVQAVLAKLAEGLQVSHAELAGAAAEVGGTLAGVSAADNAPNPMQTGQLPVTGVPDDYNYQQAVGAEKGR